MYLDKNRRFVYPNPLLRLSAFLLDSFIIVTPIAMLWGVIFGYHEMKTDNPKPYLLAIEIIAVWLVTSYLISTKAQTPGKKAFGMYVVSVGNFEKISFTRASFRFLLWLLCWVGLGIGFFIAFFSQQKQTLADKFSGTVVVRDIGEKNKDA
ncbi:MAG TPA: RDD family protein [Campylobacterales bacterium]|mgnify:CR=1 FL=1|nr:RDD family protein [Campylobacterales bacterium]